MKSFNRIFLFLIIILVTLAGVSNFLIFNIESKKNNEYKVEINRISVSIMEKGYENIDCSDFSYVYNIDKYTHEKNDFFTPKADYEIREINGEFYRFDYKVTEDKDRYYPLLLNISLAVVSVFMICTMLFIRNAILVPFEQLKNIPHELSKGNLTVPLKESRSKFFGKFVWGLDILREELEKQKKSNLKLQKEKKMLLLSLSHDIKTPLSAIKLYSKALSKGLYTEKEKQLEVAENINSKADEIERFVTQIVEASRDEFINIQINMGESYLSEIIDSIKEYYKEKMELNKTDFSVEEYNNCLIKCDIERSIEVLQNIIENALKYGDGKTISISFSEEEDCRLVTIKNSGCSIDESELPHIFDSFWRGKNAVNAEGSGLGLYICKKIMNQMNGEIFAEIQGDYMLVTLVFVKL